MVAIGYIGRPKFTVKIKNGSPFTSRPHQEWSYDLKKINEKQFTGQVNVSFINPPVNGIRLKEVIHNYDNFIEDSEGNLLEFSVDDKGNLVDKTAWLNVSKLKERRKDSGKTDAEFNRIDYAFTWVTLPTNLFKNNDDNPLSLKFSKQGEVENQGPKWTYIEYQRLDDSGNKAVILTPFQKNLPIENNKQLHWSCKTLKSWPALQGFEIFHSHEAMKYDIREEASELDCRIHGIKLKNEGDLKNLNKKAYFAINIPLTDNFSNKGLFFLFIKGQAIACLLGPDADANGDIYVSDILTSLDQIKLNNLFSQNLSEFRIKFEPVAGKIIVTSSAFDGDWIIEGLGGQNNIFPGNGNIVVYGGNVKSSFGIRPIQFAENGEFTTPGEVVDRTDDDDREVKITAAIKGLGENLSVVSGEQEGDQFVYACDTETFDGKTVKSILKYIDAPIINAGREIHTELKEKTVKTDSTYRSSSKEYSALIKMKAGKTKIGDTEIFGVSPYLWQLRGYIPLVEMPLKGQDDYRDISCAVESFDLNRSMSAYLESSHTGSIKLLMEPFAGVIIDESFIDRMLYITIDGGWSGGVAGQDTEDTEESGDTGNNNLTRIFTGIAVGGSIERVAGKKTMTLKLEDFMSALEGCKFSLSPTYDGMIAKYAVRDIAKQLGLTDSMILSGNLPIKNSPKDPFDYGIPLNNIYEQPTYRFRTGSSLKAGIIKIAEIDYRTVFFDNLGNFHYDPIPGGIRNDEDYSITHAFWTSPLSTDDPLGTIWNMYSFAKHSSDVVNAIIIKTVEKSSLEFAVAGYNRASSILDPESMGYLGYRKTLNYDDAGLGSLKAAVSMLEKTKNILAAPPSTFRFETFGNHKMGPLKIITIDESPARIINVSMRADAKDNTWWMSVEAEWFNQIQ